MFRILALCAMLLADAPAPALPPGVDPLPEALESRVEALLDQAEKYRGLEAKTAVPSGTVDDPVLRKKLVESFQADLPPERLRPVEISLKAFGLVPEELHVDTCGEPVLDRFFLKGLDGKPPEREARRALGELLDQLCRPRTSRIE